MSRQLIPESLDALRVDVDSLVLYTPNPRRGSVETIKTSLEHHGQYRPVVVNRSTRQVLAGNHTLTAARELGWSEIAATFVDVDERQAAQIVLIDNRSNDVAGWDDVELAALLRSLGSIDGTGFDEAEFERLLSAFEPVDEGEQGRLDQLTPPLVTCPECGHEFAP